MQHPSTYRNPGIWPRFGVVKWESNHQSVSCFSQVPQPTCYWKNRPLFPNFPLFGALETQLTFMAVGEPDYTWSHIKFNAILTSLSPAAHFHIQLNLTAELIWWLDSGLRFRPAQQLLQNPFLVDYYPPSLRPSCSIFTFMFSSTSTFTCLTSGLILKTGEAVRRKVPAVSPSAST